MKITQILLSPENQLLGLSDNGSVYSLNESNKQWELFVPPHCITDKEVSDGEEASREIANTAYEFGGPCRIWRNENGTLWATEPTIVEPEATLVGEWTPPHCILRGVFKGVKLG